MTVGTFILGNVTQFYYNDFMSQMETAFDDNFKTQLSDAVNSDDTEKKLKELEVNAKTSDSRYAILSLDLNFLKHTNDTYGHEKGDELIRSFADVLTNVFGMYGSVMRTGGDEFVVILEDIAEEQVKKLLAQMLDELEEKNKTESEIKLSTAYGYAMSDETVLKQDFSEELKIKVVDINPRTIYRIADDRMYENKRKSKLGRQ